MRRLLSFESGRVNTRRVHRQRPAILITETPILSSATALLTKRKSVRNISH